MTTIVHKQENVDIAFDEGIDEVFISQIASDGVEHTVVFHRKHLTAVIMALEEIRDASPGEDDVFWTLGGLQKRERESAA